MTDFSKKSQTLEFLNSILDDLRKTKVKSVFCLPLAFWETHMGYRRYYTDTELYILLENDNCLVIDYLFIDKLDLQLRKMTDEEKQFYSEIYCKDLFNPSSTYAYNEERESKTDLYSLDYGSIESVSIHSVNNEYTKWINGDIISVSPATETFDEIRFTMSNGKSITLCPASAEDDGYLLFWSEDAVENS